MNSNTENQVVRDDPPSPSTSSGSPGETPSSMSLLAATNPVQVAVSGHPLPHPHPHPQLGQCVYVLSPWRRGRTVFTGSQLSPQQNPGFRFPHPGPASVGLLRLAPYRHRPYYPPASPRPPGVPPEFPQDYRYDYYSAYTGRAEYETYSAGQEVQSTEESPARGNYESVYAAQYHPQAPLHQYGQQQCWGHAAFYGDPSDKGRTLAYYPERVGKLGAHAEFVPPDESNGPGSVTTKSVRVKFMGPEATYMTTKTLMQPVRTEGLVGIDTPDENIQVYENLQSASADGALGMNEVVIRTSTDDDVNQEHDDGKERVTFNSIEEALASIDPTSMPIDEMPTQRAPTLPASYLHVSPAAYQGLRMADEKQEEIIKAAKSLFSKRTRTLYHWLYPQTSKNKLKATVSAAWDTLHENEKQFYVSQVLGRFGLQASSLMINPQLGGIRGLPTEAMAPSTADRPRQIPPPNEPSKLAAAIEAQQAVDHLFASCEDSENWTSYCGSTPATSAPFSRPQSPTLTAAALSPSVVQGPGARTTKSRGFCGSSQGQTNNKRKRSHSRAPETGGQARLGSIDDHLDEEVTILKRMRESKMDVEYQDDTELTNDLDKFREMSQDSDRNANCGDGDDFWRRTPDPEDLFTNLEF